MGVLVYEEQNYGSAQLQGAATRQRWTGKSCNMVLLSYKEPQHCKCLPRRSHGRVWLCRTAQGTTTWHVLVYEEPQHDRASLQGSTTWHQWLQGATTWQCLATRSCNIVLSYEESQHDIVWLRGATTLQCSVMMSPDMTALGYREPHHLPW